VNQTQDPLAPVHPGQCGLCAHFGEQHPADRNLVQMRINGVAPQGYTDLCGHPMHAPLKLVVTPTAGCNGFLLAKVA
jgi:hypothetical protein